MRPQVSPLLIVTLIATSLLAGCDGCSGSGPSGPNAEERERILTSAFAAPPPAPSVEKGGGIGHAVNVIPGQGPKRIASDSWKGLAFPILPGEGIGPVRFGATKATVERLFGAPCEDATETLCRYVSRGIQLKLENGVVTEMRISRKGREAKRNPDGAIVEYGFFSGAILPDLYFGMLPAAIQQHLGAPQKVETITPIGPDGFSERHVYDGMTLEYDAWSSGNLVLGAAVLTKSETAAAASAKAEAERRKKAAESVKPLPKGSTLPQRPPR